MAVSLPRRKIAGVLFGCVAVMATGVALTACGKPASHTAARATEPCQASELRGHGGRQGENGGAHADILITNIGGVACTLSGELALSLIRSNGSVLAVRQLHGGLNGPAVLVHGKPVTLVAYWANWCGGRPGPLHLRIVMPGDAGALVVPFDGPPDYNYVPDCINPQQPATITVVAGYGAAD